MRKFFIYGLALVLLISGCSQLPLLSGLVKSQKSAEPNPADLWDDFSDKKSGWEIFNIAEGSAGYADDGYQIAVAHPNTDIFTTYTKTFVDSDIEVSAVRVGGTQDNNFGIICRFKDPENFYAGQISSDGTAGIFKVEKGKYQLIGKDKMTPVPAILGGDGINQIRFSCVGKVLTLSVNGEQVDSKEDDAFGSGEVGLIAGVVSGTSGVFRFDDFRATAR